MAVKINIDLTTLYLQTALFHDASYQSTDKLGRSGNRAGNGQVADGGRGDYTKWRYSFDGQRIAKAIKGTFIRISGVAY